MPPRLHTGGRFRAWLGRRLGGDEELGDRAWRRIIHGAGALVLAYYLVPTDFFVVAPKEYVLLAVLGVALLLELLRHVAGLQLPTIRPYEEHRVASFVFYAVALAGAILLFPLPIAAAVILGVAWVDPLVGELRLRGARGAYLWGVPVVAYFLLAVVGMAVLGGWPLVDTLGLAVLAALLGVASERPKLPWLDDDLAMTFVPALALYGVGVVWLGLPH
jgi:dolichol kinase